MSPRLPVLTAGQVLRTLKRAGFFLHHRRGSHHHLRHPDNPQLRVTVPYHAKDLSPFVLRSIIRQAGFTVQEFLDLL